MKALLLLLAGVLGLIETAAPRTVVRLLTRASYRNAADAEPRAWLHTAVRAEGAILVLVSLVGLFRVATADESAAVTAPNESATVTAPGGE